MSAGVRLGAEVRGECDAMRSGAASTVEEDEAESSRAAVLRRVGEGVGLRRDLKLSDKEGDEVVDFASVVSS